MNNVAVCEEVSALYALEARMIEQNKAAGLSTYAHRFLTAPEWERQVREGLSLRRQEERIQAMKLSL